MIKLTNRIMCDWEPITADYKKLNVIHVFKKKEKKKLYSFN